MLLVANPPQAVFAQKNSPEIHRLDADEFRAGLQERGLVEILEYCLTVAPPGEDVASRLLRRDILLAAYDDATRPESERLDALGRANDILRELITEHQGDRRLLQWRFDLGRSLLFQQGEPHCAAVLYYGGTPQSRRTAAALMDEAVTHFRSIETTVEAEFARLERLSLAAYERLDRAGVIEDMEQMQPQAAYMRRWATFYRAIVRDEGDPARIGEFQSVVTDLRDRTNLLTIPHEKSHHQAQALLLAGACAWRYGDVAGAIHVLSQSIDVIDLLTDPAEINSLRWVGTLARLELARAYRAMGKFDRALEASADFRVWVSKHQPGEFSLDLAAAMFEASVLREQARVAEASGNARSAERLRDRSLRPLIELARRNERARSTVYAQLYRLIDRQAAPMTMHPFERCAMLAGLLADAERLPDTDGAAAMLDRAVEIAEQTLANPGGIDDAILAETRYNLGVAYYRTGRRSEAVRSFLAGASGADRGAMAFSAVKLAVQIASEMHNDPTLRNQPEVQDLYLQALQALITGFPNEQETSYWRFFLAQLLRDMGRYAEAADAFAAVDSHHEFALQARYMHVHCLAQVVRQLAAQADTAVATIAASATTAITGAREFVRRAHAGEFADQSDAIVTDLVERCLIDQAEVSVLRGVERHDEALGVLQSFDAGHARSSELMGRVLRTQSIALEALGRLDEAERAIQAFIDREPALAGPTLQTLFDLRGDEIERLRDAGKQTEAQSRADAALVVARKIVDWSDHPDSEATDATRRALRVQLGEAHLQAGKPADALRILLAVLRISNPSAIAVDDTDPRIVLDVCDALFDLGRQEEALPLYNGVFRVTGVGNELGWHALWGDLRCRTALGQPADDIVRVIRQHRFLHPDMGGDRMRARFDALLLDNESRQAGT